MIKAAYVNNNIIERIVDVADMSEITDSHQYQIVIDITDYEYMPQVGWAYKNGVLFNDLPPITPKQLRQALILSGVTLQSIVDMLHLLPEPQQSLALVAWDYAIQFDRRDPLLLDMSAQLGLIPAQIDQLWGLALTL